jgi:hypothetical protein
MKIWTFPAAPEFVGAVSGRGNRESHPRDDREALPKYRLRMQVWGLNKSMAVKSAERSSMAAAPDAGTCRCDRTRAGLSKRQFNGFGKAHHDIRTV